MPSHFIILDFISLTIFGKYKINFEKKCGGVDWIELCQDMINCRFPGNRARRSYYKN